MAGFASQVASFSQQTHQKLDRIRRRSILSMFRLIVQSTPVDSGRLINNWRTNVGAPNISERTALSLSGVDSLAEVFTNMGLIHETVYFTNNLPYAERIEYDGWSQYKAPAGMVRIHISRWPELVRNAASEEGF
jgi:hypothetical protein